MSLKRALRSGVAAACIASVAAPAGIAAPAAQGAARPSSEKANGGLAAHSSSEKANGGLAAHSSSEKANGGLAAHSSSEKANGGLAVRVATTETFSRIEMAGRVPVRREGQILTLALKGDPDVARLLTSPPKWIKSVTRKRVGKGVELAVTLADDAEAKIGQADGTTYVNVFEKPAPEIAPAPVVEEVAIAEAEPPRPNPLPPGGVVKMDAKAAGGQVQLSFTWANPAGAAVFRRGDAIWVVFDAPATLDVSATPKGVRPVRSVQAFKGGDHAAIRIDADPDAPVFAGALGNTWTIAVGPGSQALPSIVRVARDSAGGPATLKAPVAGATRVVNLPDPVVGDTLTVVTALGPAKGVPSRRDYVDAALLPSVQGLAIEPLVEDLSVSREGEIVRISRGAGLTLSPIWATRDKEEARLGAPQPAIMPALVNPDWAQTGPGGFRRRYDALLAAATVESGAKDRQAPVGARMALARFLVGSALSYEAIGVLNALARAHPEMLDDPEFRGLRGVSRALAHRYAEADTDLSAPSLADDPSAALWRAYVATQLAQYAEARAFFAKGIEAYAMVSPLWKARFARADAQAALAQGDLVGADGRIRMALAEKVGPEEQLRARLIQARVIELQGHKARALKIFAAVATAPVDSISAPAQLRATQIRLELGQITPVQAAGVYDGLRYRWRGDGTELETVRALGQLYLSQGRYREALEALRSAGVRLPDLPEALQLQADLNAAFRGLFLDGLADGLEPTQALALFFDFKELAPIGADGDLMVRKIVRRLVDVDLLPQAAELLKYQAENRLDGVPKAQVSTDLAVIYLMDRKPEQALEAINASRTTVLPTALNAERRLIEGRAWAALGRYDSALEIIGKDASREGSDLRAEITWKQKNWAVAGPLFEKALGDRYKTAAPLTSDEEGRLLRAGVAYSLAGDEGALARLQGRYQGFYEKANNPEALRIALSGVPTGRLSVADFGRVSADNEAFAGWVAKMKGRFKTKPVPVGAAKAPAKPVAPAKQAQATPPAKA